MRSEEVRNLMNLFFLKSLRDIRKRKLRSLPILLIIIIGGVICILYSSLYLNWMEIEESSWNGLYYHHLLLTFKPSNSSYPESIINTTLSETGIEAQYELRSFLETQAFSDLSDSPVAVQLFGIRNQELLVDNLYYYSNYITRLYDSAVPNQVVVDRITAQKENWELGSNLSITTSMGLLNTTIVAYVESPEFLMEPGLVTEFYGGWDGPVIWMRRSDLTSHLNSSQHINQAAFYLPDPTQKNRLLESILTQMGVDSVLQINGRDSFLSAIAPTFSGMAIIFICLFSGIAAIMILIVLKRVIEEELSVLALFKSLGFTNYEVVSGAFFYSLIIGSIGAVLGGVLGFILGSSVGGMYIEMAGIKRLPTSSGVTMGYLIIPVMSYIVFVLIFIILGAFLASRRLINLSPIEAFRPLASLRSGHKSIVELLILKVNKTLSPLSKFSLRSIFQEKRKASFIILGLVLATSLSFFGATTSISFLSNMEKNFGYYQTWDAQVFLSSYQNETEISQLIKDIELVEYESFISAPIRLKNDLTQIYTVIGLQPETKMRNFDEGGVPPNQEIVISKDLAIKFNFKRGDALYLYDLLAQEHTFRVASILNEMTGSALYISISAARSLLSLDASEANGIFIQSKNTSSIKLSLENHPLITKLVLKSDLEKSFKEIGQIAIGSFLFGATGAALVLGVSITVTTVSISISERKYDFVNFRALGFSNKEIFLTVLYELVLVGIIGVFIGHFTGYWITNAMFTWAADFGVVFVMEVSIMNSIVPIITVGLGIVIATYLSLRSLFRTTISEETVSRLIG